MDTNQLANRRVIVTGGLGALGRGVGAALTERGATVALVDRAAQTEAAGVALVVGGVDLSDTASAASAFAKVEAAFGGIDALVNVAGGFAWETLEGGSVETWDRLYAVNLRTAVIASHEALPYLLREEAGRIVNVGALAAQKAGLGMGAYAASKSGVARFTEALAEELKDRNINVNAVLPSILDTPANRNDMPDADVSRWVSIDALAAVIAFLLSDDARAMNGASLPVAGRV
ncbi:SDR family NAD(P)-dependent oxidoreductase [Paraburkholderia dinghuensis]|uniref:SDR family NAD(P)-dependent oxidoreductase n=1 Tax=Paraburkholderia dinghuensis TaxID=2305225 RepID=A0A3N6PY00_9BURK|nr:SDR family NAD(P)-dependent oxidoreductase [Paraburkholderia dinghuensis]RQH04906.1 SDR family NAD(P)-dependent oxidoreductase [Paraburkholderia dinghuensis]